MYSPHMKKSRGLRVKGCVGYRLLPPETLTGGAIMSIRGSCICKGPISGPRGRFIVIKGSNRAYGAKVNGNMPGVIAIPGAIGIRTGIGGGYGILVGMPGMGMGP